LWIGGSKSWEAAAIQTAECAEPSFLRQFVAADADVTQSPLRTDSPMRADVAGASSFAANSIER